MNTENPTPRLVPDRPSVRAVPVTLTEEMIEAAIGHEDVQDMWDAMLAAAPPGEAPAEPKSALVQKAIGQLRAMGEWDGKTFDEDLHATLRELTALDTDVAAEAPAELGDKGPWKIGAGSRDVYSGDFVADVALRISGDFEGEMHRIRYAEWLCETLNRAAAPAAPANVPSNMSDDHCDAAGDDADCDHSCGTVVVCATCGEPAAPAEGDFQQWFAKAFPVTEMDANDGDKAAGAARGIARAAWCAGIDHAGGNSDA